ncbi:hypothetical protein BBJ29_008717 [Phytophthora kernoviae]|uniref:Uncharacterized protein n=1 Tax=Phytophthora kernoviae TaxID=325452 RepID=A0A3F2RJV3_9STRA|nr:hypothetical protein BBP00_00007629 [Phytophthora kernoviae]RLN65719.1 hypothetical protein BBJ29_008717 [Phytophthora kernoviae]
MQIQMRRTSEALRRCISQRWGVTHSVSSCYWTTMQTLSEKMWTTIHRCLLQSKVAILAVLDSCNVQWPKLQCMMMQRSRYAQVPVRHAWIMLCKKYF